MKSIISNILIVLFSLSCAPRATAGDGWVRLSMMDVQEQSWRDVAPTKFLSVRLDMDGDGKKDAAAIVVSRDLKKSAIRVCFGGTARKQQCQIIAKSENIADVMGLEQKNRAVTPTRRIILAAHRTGSGFVDGMTSLSISSLVAPVRFLCMRRKAIRLDVTGIQIKARRAGLSPPLFEERGQVHFPVSAKRLQGR
jgi:hypothetical protein